MLTNNTIYAISENVVAREIEGELIIVPLVSGIGDNQDELFTLNDTGKAIWSKLDGKTDLETIIDQLSKEYGLAKSELEKDVFGFTEELLKRKILIQNSLN